MAIFSAGKIIFEFYVLTVFLKFPTFLQAFVTSVHQKIKNKTIPQSLVFWNTKLDVMCPRPLGIWQVPICYSVLLSLCPQLGRGQCAETRWEVNKAADFAEDEDMVSPEVSASTCPQAHTFLLPHFLPSLPPSLSSKCFPLGKTFFGPWDEVRGVEGK